MKNKQSKKAKEIGKLIGEEEYYEKLKQALIASVGDENEKAVQVFFKFLIEEAKE